MNRCCDASECRNGVRRRVGDGGQVSLFVMAIIACRADRPREIGPCSDKRSAREHAPLRLGDARGASKLYRCKMD